MEHRRGGDHEVIVIVTVDATVDVIDEMVEHARVGIERFADCGGHLGGTRLG